MTPSPVRPKSVGSNPTPAMVATIRQLTHTTPGSSPSLFTVLHAELLRAEATAPAVEKLSAIEQSKRLAAYTAVDKHVLPEHKVRIFPYSLPRQLY